MEAVGLVALALLVVSLYETGALRWLWMAACFVISQRGERRDVLLLHWKLEVLKWLARHIGAAERTLGK